MPFGILQALLMGLLGVLCGIFYSFGELIIDGLVTFGILSSEAVSTPGLSTGTLLAFGALIGMPTIFIVIDFLKESSRGFCIIYLKDGSVAST